MGLQDTPSRPIRKAFVILLVCFNFFVVISTKSNFTKKRGHGYGRDVVERMEVDKNDIVSVQRQEGWFEVGCMDQMDGEGEDEYIQNIHNNPKRCIDHCKTKNSAFAGVQGKECRCGNSPPSGRIDWDWKKCNWPCKGGDCGNWWIVYSTEG